MASGSEWHRSSGSLRLALLGAVAVLLVACGEREGFGSLSGPATSTTAPQPTATVAARETPSSPTAVATVKQTDEEARRQDARMYADEQGISLEEALARLEQAEDVGQLGAILEASEPETFAGAYLQHQPEYRFVVLFTRDAEETIRPYVEGTAFEDLIEVREVRFSYVELKEAQAEAGDMLAQIGGNVSSGINVMENQVELYVFDGEQVEALLDQAGLKLPEPVVFIEGGEGEVSPDYNPTPVPGVYFAQFEPQLGPQAQMAALLVGKLVLVDGCLQIETDYGAGVEYTVPIWPADHQLRVEGEVIEVLNGDGEVVARVGESVDMGGGEASQDPNQLSEQLREPLPETCHGPYWIVGGTSPLGTGPGSS